jgi:hypothetical protein
VKLCGSEANPVEHASDQRSFTILKARRDFRDHNVAVKELGVT